jgi:hypothetical protein
MDELQEALFKKKLLYNSDIKKGHKFSIKDEEIMFGHQLKPEDSSFINEHSLLANPGVYIHSYFIHERKGDVRAVIVNEPYEKFIYAFEPWSHISIELETLKKIFKDYDCVPIRIATPEEAAHAQPGRWTNVLVRDDMLWTAYRLYGDGDTNTAAAMHEIEPFLDNRKKWQSPDMVDKKDLLFQYAHNNYFARSYFVVDNVFISSNDLESIANEEMPKHLEDDAEDKEITAKNSAKNLIESFERSSFCKSLVF